MSAPVVAIALVPLAERASWQASLAGIPHGFAHTWESCDAFAASSGHPTFLLRATAADGSRVVCPLAERRGAVATAADVVTPYGFSGPVGDRPCPELPAAWHAFAREQGWACGYLSLHPLFGDASYVRRDEVAVANRLQVLDLERSEAELRAGLDENRRRELRRFARDPAAELFDGTAPGDRAMLRDFFLARHAGFFAAREASPLYRFAPATVERLFAAPSTLALGVALAGEVVAVALFGSTPWAGEYLFNVSLPQGRRFSAVLVWEGALRLRAHGVPVLSLGGGVRDGDGVAAFKERFGARALPLAAARQIYDPAAFRRLALASGALAEARGDYFPPWRDPRAPSAGARTPTRGSA